MASKELETIRKTVSEEFSLEELEQRLEAQRLPAGVDGIYGCSPVHVCERCEGTLCEYTCWDECWCDGWECAGTFG